MKIVINALSARLGGGQTYLRNLLDHLPERSELEILVFAPSSLPLPPDPRVRRGKTHWPNENPILRTIWEVFALPRILSKEGASVLFCPGGIIATAAPAQCKTVTMFRNMIPFDPTTVSRIPFGLQRVRNFILRRVMLKSLASADLAIFISDYARSVIESLTRVGNPVTIPHGIGPEFRTAGKSLERPKWLPPGEYLLYVSRFDVYKHQLEIAEAFCALPVATRDRYRLVFVGAVTPAKASEIADLAQRSGAGDKVVVQGPVAHSDLPGAYHHAAANVFASSCENCPNILLEALGSGRPLLSSNVMPMPEFGADAVEYFAPSDAASIRNAMRKVLEDDAHACLLGEKAARRSENYDWALTAHRTWRYILGVVAQ